MKAIPVCLLAIPTLFGFATAQEVQTSQRSAIRPAAAHLVEQTRDLSVRLDKGQIWRQGVEFRTELDFGLGEPTAWVFDYTLRLKCVEAEADYRIEGALIDWKLRLEKGDCRVQWHKGQFRHEGEFAWSDGQPSACRDLMRAWSDGLRNVELRFRLDRAGRIHEFRGLEDLKQSVSAALASLEQVPEAFSVYFGEKGLQRAETILQIGLSVPRPMELAKVGQSWDDKTWVAGVIGDRGLLQRRFEIEGFGRVARHRVGNIRLTPAAQRELSDGQLQMIPAASRAPKQENRLELLTDNGLIRMMDIRLAFQLEQRPRLPLEAAFRLRSELLD